jgi:ABC-2 type transport system permease protein
MGIVLGLVAQSAGSTLEDTSVAKFLGRLGGRGNGATLYLGVSFILVTTMILLLVAGQLAAARDEEAQGRLDHLLVRPVGRVRWLAGRLGVATGLAVAGGLLAGAATLAGAASQHTGVDAWRLLEAGLNVVPPALFLLGLGALVLGWRPRAAVALVYGVAAWSLLIELIGGAVDASHWLLDTSVLHHVAPAPAVPPNWTSAAVLFAAGLAMAAAGTARFAGRDLQSA